MLSGFMVHIKSKRVFCGILLGALSFGASEALPDLNPTLGGFLGRNVGDSLL